MKNDCKPEFESWLELEPEEKLIYHFYDGKIPMMQDGKLQYIDVDKVVTPKGFSIYKDVRGVAIVEIPSNKTEYYSYFYGKELKNEELSEFLALFEAYRDINDY